MRVTLALRWRLLLLWLFMLVVSGALAYIIRDVYQLGSEAQAEKSVEQTIHACVALQTEYSRSVRPGEDIIDRDLMSALLNVILDDLPGVEGGFWHDSSRFVAYAFPSHVGSEEKKDVPPTERNRVEALARKSFVEGKSMADVLAGSHEIVTLAACPVNPEGHLAAWAMMRSPVAAGEAYDEVNRGLGLLLAFVIISGLWLAFSLYGWSKRFTRMERDLAESSRDVPWEMARTGDAELDRIVTAFNQFRTRLDAERAHIAELGTLIERSERFTALGRMAAAVAHEVRNPLAAMQLKAENALVRPNSERMALEFILREIKRLDETVKELLKKAEPISTQFRLVHITDWLMERVGAFEEQGVAASIGLRTEAGVESWTFDPHSLGRALDNLIANALQHTPSGGIVTVTANKNALGTTMILQVCDTGPGVSANVEPTLFEPFTSGRPAGVGLGLALAREIAVAHGGEARYLRKASGACFELEIPWHAS
ncbi:MAG TPA: HAMP domain-containing sensor histidine kinase [Nitrosospira sp.]|nr:HAMP domain-containing sensor histidine kinase [Nitrosospira sp.]